MMRVACLLLPAAAFAVPVAPELEELLAPRAMIPLTTFDGNKATTQPWAATNDPVMGGVSHSTFTVGSGWATWSGEVKVVPKLHAPGFCTATCGGYRQQPVKLPDISSAEGLLVTVRNMFMGGLASFKVSMSIHEMDGFEARFNTSAGRTGWTTHFLPFSAFTQESRGQPHGGSPTAAQLKAISGLGFNQDGVAGKFNLEIKEIAAGSPGGGGGGGGKTLDLVTFKEGDKTNYKWTDLNDPVMGGRSTSTFKVEAGKGVFDGVCRIVPQLKAPGFCNAEARPGLLEKIADASAFIAGGLELELTSTGNLTQFKAAFGSRAQHDFGSFKADFTVQRGPNTVRVPFTSFSNKWSSSTGEPTVKCDAEHRSVCPTAHSLATIGAIGVWAEGFAGAFHLELTAIRAYVGGSSPPGPSPGPGPTGCTGASVNLKAEQCAAWGKFWDGTGGPNWGSGKDCSKSDPCGCGHGVGCGPKKASSDCSLSDSCDSTITTIELHSSGLVGTIPDAVGAFVDMEYFSVGGNNRLNGSLPASMSAWKNVKIFDVRDTKFNGALPVLNYRAMRPASGCVLCGAAAFGRAGCMGNAFSCPFPQGVTDRCQKFNGNMEYQPITNADCYNSTASE